jgi:hypothetical protein
VLVDDHWLLKWLGALQNFSGIGENASPLDEWLDISIPREIAAQFSLRSIDSVFSFCGNNGCPTISGKTRG